jgi:hypothetical protein
MKRSVLLLCISMSLIFGFGQSNPSNRHVSAIPLLSKVYIDGVLFTEYTYNQANLISEEKSKYQYIKYDYNEKKQLISLACYQDVAFFSSDSRVLETAKSKTEWASPENSTKIKDEKFEYSNIGQLTKLTDISGYCSFDYDSENRITRQNYHRNDTIYRYIDFAYDKKGNLLKMCNFEFDNAGKPQLIFSYEYEFDNKLNPYKAFSALGPIFGKYTNYNNIKKETQTMLIMENQKQTITYEYEYNADGYPVTVNKSMKYIYK